MRTFKILTFDGGGIRGALSIEILHRIMLRYPNLLENVDLLSGTSTGSIIASLLAKGISVDEIRNLYDVPTTKKIFSHGRINLFKAKYKNDNFNQILSNYFPDNIKLSDLKKKILIPAFNINSTDDFTWEPIFFNNFTKDGTENISVKDAVLSSSAAPTYFPSYNQYIDGGVIANSPTTASLLFVYKTYKKIFNINNIKILSIGTGNIPERINGKNKNWGLFQWAFNPFKKMKSPILSLLMDGMEDLNNMYCKELLNYNYFRINPKIPKFIDLDEYKYTPYLKAIAHSYDLSKAFDYIEKFYLK
ncbi:patatin-like phospholipase family protein [Caproiciproducens sp. MSJ-32]|uniref:patatin-like phospholipase family protein n=1 Tax=Caproiciproducens sp. MSJ-32 TaxID=2841527 RepID=UPI001C128B9F|nr:patatin-like phospholipase family protein [Caproiciproducens sp. MSJ-32]MBU5453908.1 patatin-like phospholipase family protein [Caproiciproducens sp. MSJ-32]